MSPPPADPFDTAGLRAAVLDAWRSSPTRYREDANVEEDYALGAYRDRLIVELAQNAADAARTAGVVCRMLIQLGEHGMAVSNTGAPLDIDGVRSLAAMRASAKSDENSVGRFGVGFAAVLSVSDAPAIASRNGGVRFSRSDSAEVMRHDAVLADLLMDRQPPVLRLPFSDDGGDVGDYDTTVTLPWHDHLSRERAIEAVRGIDDALFIALPELAELRVEGAPQDVAKYWATARQQDVLTITVDEHERRWRLQATSGDWSRAELATASTEERSRTSWSFTWAVPVAPDGGVSSWTADASGPRRVVHAPTPTDEPLALPALLVGDFPVDASRRRLVEGPMTETMLSAAAKSYVDLVRQTALESGADAASLVPGPDLVGPIDDRLRRAIRDRLTQSAWLSRGSDGELAAPSQLVVVEPSDDELVRVLAAHVTDLVAPEWLPYASMLRGLGVVTRSWADVWDVVAGLPITGDQWHAIYEAASGLDRSSLEGLPVPLGDGRVVRDPRRCVLLIDGAALSDDLRTLGLPVVDAVAAHPLLERLGAQPFDPRRHLGAEFIARVESVVELDPLEARELVQSAARVLSLSGAAPGELADLGGTPVLTQGGDWLAASRVVMPVSRLSADVDPDLLLDAQLASESRDGWLALGVLGSLTVVEVEDLPLDEDTWDALIVDGGGWCDEVAAVLDVRSSGELLATSARLVRGLEHLEGMEADRALALVSSPEVRRAIVEPALVVDAAGRTHAVRPPAAWWLSEAPLFEGRRPIEVRLAGDDRLASFFPVIAPAAVDVGLLEAIGVHTTLEAWLDHPEGVGELLAAMGDEAVALDEELIPALYDAIAAAGATDEAADVPERVRAMVGGKWQVVDASQALVARAPHHAAVLTTPFVPGDEALADLLAVDLSDDASCDAGSVAGTGELRDVPQGLGGEVAKSYYEHDTIEIREVSVDWWVTDEGEVHACTVDGLARALAWASGQWHRRWELVARLSGDVDQARETVDGYFDR